MSERKIVVVDGVEIDAPADMPIEEIEKRHRELQETIDRTRAELETTDSAAVSRAIADDLEARGWPADAIAFARANADTTEIAALERSLGRAPTSQEYLAWLREQLDARLGEG